MAQGAETGKVLLAVSAGIAAATAVVWWWMRRGKRGPDPQSFQTPVGKVAKLYLYPLKSCHRIEVESAQCLIRGLKYDR